MIFNPIKDFQRERKKLEAGKKEIQGLNVRQKQKNDRFIIFIIT